MPDKDGKLTEAEKKQISEWLDGRWPADRQACPVCGDTTWLIADHLVMPMTIGAGGGVQLGGVGYPQVQAISLKCGYTRVFNAPLMGLKLDAKPEEPKPEEQKTDVEKKAGEG